MPVGPSAVYDKLEQLSTSLAGLVKAQGGSFVAASAGVDYAAAAHVHAIADVTGLQPALDGKSDVGHTHTASEVTDFATAADARITAQKGMANGLATLGSGGKIPSAQLPSIAISDFLGSVGSQAAMLALNGERGDWCIRNDILKTYILTGDDPSVLANWQALVTPEDVVLAVNNQVGDIHLTTTDIPEGVNPYFSDALADGRIAAAVGATVQAWDADLDAVAAVATTGFVRRTGPAAWAASALVAADVPPLDAAKITTGTVDTARLGSGTPDATKFLRGDQTWAVPTAAPTPAGSDTQVQFNDAGALAGDGNFIWDKVAQRVTVKAAGSAGSTTGLLIKDSNGNNRFDARDNGTVKLSNLDGANGDGLILSVAGTGRGKCTNAANWGFGSNAINDSNQHMLVVSESTTKPTLVLKLRASQTADLFAVQDSAANPLAAIGKVGEYRPASMADASAPNNSVYYSTTASKLVYKDSGGVVNVLY